MAPAGHRPAPVRLRDLPPHPRHSLLPRLLLLGDDQLWGVTREHKGGDHTLGRAEVDPGRPGRGELLRLFVICDNLAANKTPAIRRWARRENVELCLTPTNASWANPIEAHFGPLRPCYGQPDHPNHPALARKLQAYLRWRNAHARPMCWPPSAANAPASAANASNAGDARSLKRPNQSGERSWPAR